jgi:hypothetical protein
MLIDIFSNFEPIFLNIGTGLKLSRAPEWFWQSPEQTDCHAQALQKSPSSPFPFAGGCFA